MVARILLLSESQVKVERGENEIDRNVFSLRGKSPNTSCSLITNVFMCKTHERELQLAGTLVAGSGVR